MSIARHVPILLTTHGATFTAECVALPSCKTTGRTREEALAAVTRLVEALLRAGATLAPSELEVTHVACAGLGGDGELAPAE